MGLNRFNRAMLSVGGEDREFVVSESTTRTFAMLEELRFVRRAAQSEADLAYADWASVLSSETYMVFRAAQDRADVAQDVLADYWQRARDRSQLHAAV